MVENRMKTLVALECMEIKELCDKYGYGNVMEWASALWRYDLLKKGFPESGAFIVASEKEIYAKHRKSSQRNFYDNLVYRILGD